MGANEQHNGRNKRYLDIEEAAEYLDLSVSWLYKLTSARKIPFYKPGRSLRFKPEDLDEWMENFRFEPVY
jgi:excisionase family DNA binding protein